jgi:hypothetical protein
MALGKIKNDIKFFDPVTMEVICTYNGCHSKFDLMYEEKIYVIPTRKSSSVSYTEQYRVCNECNKKFQSDIDKKVSLSNRTNSVNAYLVSEHEQKS